MPSPSVILLTLMNEFLAFAPSIWKMGTWITTSQPEMQAAKGALFTSSCHESTWKKTAGKGLA